MAITYTPTTNFGAKDSLPTNDPDKVIKGSEFTTEFTAIQTAFGLAAPAASPTFTGTVTIGSVDINGGAIDGTIIGGATPAAGSFTTVSATGNITVGGTVDGRDVAADGTKLDGVEAGADVTDTANVTAAGALMDSELTDIAAVKALNQGVATTDSPSFAGLTATGSVSLAGASTSADITFGDNDKAIFGAGSDLQIYHDASDSVILDNGTGNLKIQADDLVLKNADGSKEYLKGTNGGSVRIRYNNTTVLETTATGIDVTGTVTADGLTVDNGSVAGSYAVISNTEGSAKFGTDSNYARILDGSNNILLAQSNAESYYYNNGVKVIKTASGGDISFYEDTGTTAKFFWDASAERLGVGTSSPYGLTHWQDNSTINLIATNSGADSQTDTTVLSLIGQARSYGNNIAKLASIDFKTDATSWFKGNITFNVANSDGTNPSLTPLEAMRIDASGVVQISNATPTLKFTDTDNNYDATIQGLSGSLVLTADSGAEFGTESIQFKTGGSEAMRIDSSGNLLVGKTSSGIANSGFEVGQSGQINVTQTGAVVGRFNRKTSDGSILELQKDGTTVGSIGVEGGDLTIGNADTGLQFVNTSQIIRPQNLTTNSAIDAQVDLGQPAYRFKDLYLSGGVYLGGTGAANLLDDYEEGTWTPTVVGSTSGSITGFTVSGANYTKVGRVVSLNCYLSSVDISSSTISGEVRIASLPFTSANFTGVVLSTYCNWFTLDESDITVSGYTQGDELRLLKGSSTSPITNSDLSTGVTNGVIMINVVYMTS